MGQPFEGHALTGYDTAAKQYVSWWIDSASALVSHTAGSFDAAEKVCTMSGECIDPKASRSR